MGVHDCRVAVLAFSLLGCGRELFQTAYLKPETTSEAAGGAETDAAPGLEPQGVALSCRVAVTNLPQAPAFARGEVQGSPLVSTNYAADEGPGLWISARDAYRVYLNGVLIAESQIARASSFIPMTLLPGDNALSVAVWAAAGTPAAALQLDELSGSYVSDGSWRVSVAPGAGFADAGFDAAAWPAASDYGRVGELPGCDPSPGTLTTSEARWIGPQEGTGTSAVLRRVIRIAPEGAGQGATGGGDAAPQLATTWQELQSLAEDPTQAAVILLAEGTYDLRRTGDEIDQRDVCPSVCPDDPQKPQYRLSNRCSVQSVKKPVYERRLRVGSNKTIVGLGRGAQLRGVTFFIREHANIVIRNLALYDVNRALIEASDALSIESVDDTWIDHVTTKWISDGFADIYDSQGLTLSWMHFDGVSPDACRGQHPRLSQIQASTLTMHHSFFDHPVSNSPEVRRSQSRVHLYNNVVQDADGDSVGASCGAQVLLEGTTFKTVTTPTARRGCTDDPSLGLISAPSGSNRYLADVGAHAGGDGLEPHDSVFIPAYEYELEPAAVAGPDVLRRAGVGGRWALPLTLSP